jgi:hypothetical protein
MLITTGWPWSRRQKLIVLGSLTLIELGAVSLAMFGSGDRHAPARRPAGPIDHIAAAITPVSSSLVLPLSPELIHVRNTWMVSDGRTLVAVYAGSAGYDRQSGRFVIIRQNLELGSQTQTVVDVPGAGAIEIDRAPTGAAVETSAQRSSLHFRGASGSYGTLDLSQNLASLN